MRRERLGVSAPVDCWLDACILRRDDRGELRADPPRLTPRFRGETSRRYAIRIQSLTVGFSARLVCVSAKLQARPLATLPAAAWKRSVPARIVTSGPSHKGI